MHFLPWSELAAEGDVLAGGSSRQRLKRIKAEIERGPRRMKHGPEELMSPPIPPRFSQNPRHIPREGGRSLLSAHLVAVTPCCCDALGTAQLPSHFPQEDRLSFHSHFPPVLKMVCSTARENKRVLLEGTQQVSGLTKAPTFYKQDSERLSNLTKLVYNS